METSKKRGLCQKGQKDPKKPHYPNGQNELEKKLQIFWKKWF